MPVTIDYRIQTDEYQRRVAWLPEQGRRDVPGLRWADVLRALYNHLGLPATFRTVDFLTSMTFPVDDLAGEPAQLTAAFCSQGRRRGEVLLSIPATVQNAADLMRSIGDTVESFRDLIRQDAIAAGVPADHYDAPQEEESWF